MKSFVLTTAIFLAVSLAALFSANVPVPPGADFMYAMAFRLGWLNGPLLWLSVAGIAWASYSVASRFTRRGRLPARYTGPFIDVEAREIVEAGKQGGSLERLNKLVPLALAAVYLGYKLLEYLEWRAAHG